MRDSLVFYRTFMDAIESLPLENQLDAYKAVVKYAMDGVIPEDGVAKAILLLCKKDIDNNNAKYENSKNGGRPKTKPEPNQNQTETKPKPNDNQTETKTEPQAIQNETEPKPIYVECNNVIKEKPSKEGKKKSDLLGLEDPVLLSAVKDYENHRKKIKAPLTERALDLALKKLEELAPGDTPTKVEIINQSIMNGWKGLFELKKSKPPDKPTRGMEREEDLDAMVLGRILNRG